MYYTRSVCVTTSTRGFLAVGTKVGAALANDDFFDCGAAALTGLPGAAIGLEVILLCAFGTIAITIITESAAAVFDGLAKHRADGRQQFLSLIHI